MFATWLVGACMLPLAVPADAAVTCSGHPATLVMSTPGSFTGTTGPDVIVGTAGDDTIYGKGGVDFICGGDGNDVLYGGNGNDTLRGANGNDALYGDAGDDRLLPGVGDDSINGDIGVDTLSYQDPHPDWVTVDLAIVNAAQATNGSGSDTLLDEVENLTGTDGNDTLKGTDGNNVIVGRGGSDFITPRLGNDRLTAGGGPYGPYGGDNTVVFVYDHGTGVTIDLNVHTPQATSQGTKTLTDNFGGAWGTKYADVLRGYGAGVDPIYNGYNSLHGWEGDDKLVGRGGNDYLYGGLGDDLLKGGAGTNDSCDGELGTGDTTDGTCESVANVP